MNEKLRFIKLFIQLRYHFSKSDSKTRARVPGLNSHSILSPAVRHQAPVGPCGWSEGGPPGGPPLGCFGPGVDSESLVSEEEDEEEELDEESESDDEEVSVNVDGPTLNGNENKNTNKRQKITMTVTAAKSNKIGNNNISNSNNIYEGQ